jgi:hypothetical protein
MFAGEFHFAFQHVGSETGGPGDDKVALVPSRVVADIFSEKLFSVVQFIFKQAANVLCQLVI